MKFGTPNHATELSNKMMDSLGRYLDILSRAVTNGGSTSEQYTENFTNLENSIVTLTETNKNQQDDIWALLEENTNMKNKVATPDAGGG